MACMSLILLYAGAGRAEPGASTLHAVLHMCLLYVAICDAVCFIHLHRRAGTGFMSEQLFQMGTQVGHWGLHVFMHVLIADPLSPLLVPL